MKRVILIFNSVHYTLEAEACLKSARWSFLVVPIPPSVSGGCGLGIQIEPADQQAVAAYLEQSDIAPIKRVELE